MRIRYQGSLSQKKNRYFQVMSIGFSDSVWKIFASLINLTNERNNKLKFFTDPILIKINCNRKLSLNKMTYFMTQIRGKIRLVIDAYVCSSKIMLPI